jgi:hypothetical protein
MQIHAESPDIEKQPSLGFIKTIATLQLPRKKLQHLLGLLLLTTEHGSALGNGSLLLALTGSLGLSTLSIHLLLDVSLTGSLSLGLVDLYRKSASEFVGGWMV